MNQCCLILCFGSNLTICLGLVLIIMWKNIYDCQLSIHYFAKSQFRIFFTKNSLQQTEFSDFNFFFQNRKKEIEASELLIYFIYFSVQCLYFRPFLGRTYSFFGASSILNIVSRIKRIKLQLPCVNLEANLNQILYINTD